MAPRKPAANFGLFSGLVAGAAKAIGVAGPKFACEALEMAVHHSIAVERLSKLGFPSSSDPKFHCIAPGRWGTADALLEDAGSLLFPFSKNAGLHRLGVNYRGGGDGAAMAVVFNVLPEENERHQKMIPSARDGASEGHLLLFPTSSDFRAAIFAAGLDDSSAKVFSMGHEAGHWIWAKEGFGRVLLDRWRAGGEANALPMALVDLAGDDGLQLRANETCGFLPEVWKLFVHVRFLAEEAGRGAEETFCDMVGAVATDDPPDTWRRVRAARRSPALAKACPRYRAVDAELSDRIERELASPSRIGMERMIPHIADAAGRACASWLFSSGSRSENLLRLHALACASHAAAESDAEGGFEDAGRIDELAAELPSLPGAAVAAARSAASRWARFGDGFPKSGLPFLLPDEDLLDLLLSTLPHSGSARRAGKPSGC